MSSQPSINYYSVLEIPQHASQADIEKAFEVARQTYSLENPDIYNIFSHSEAMAWNKLVDDAYSTLCHPASREIYNQELAQQSRVVPTNIDHFSLEQEKQTSMHASVTPDANFGSTVLSSYAIDPEMELAIENQDIFDGLFLKKIRSYKNVELQAFVSKTCIAQRHIYAIENNNFSVLPAAVFVRGYIIQYCRILNLDEQKVVSSFMALLSDDRTPEV